MRVKRIICPSCKVEKKVVSDEDNTHEYIEEFVSEVCGKEECRNWYYSPEQKLLRAIFGERS